MLHQFRQPSNGSLVPGAATRTAAASPAAPARAVGPAARRSAGTTAPGRQRGRRAAGPVLPVPQLPACRGARKARRDGRGGAPAGVAAAAFHVVRCPPRRGPGRCPRFATFLCGSAARRGRRIPPGRPAVVPLSGGAGGGSRRTGLGREGKGAALPPPARPWMVRGAARGSPPPAAAAAAGSRWGGARRGARRAGAARGGAAGAQDGL